jgi:hypothetical protein
MSALEAVAPTEAPPAPKWTDSLENNELRKLGVGVAALLVIGAGIAFVLTRPDPAPSANSLPPPASTTTVEIEPTTSEPPPSLVGGARPATGFLPGTPREVGEGLAPWETPPAIDFVTGLLLDESLDYTGDTARVAELLDAFPEEFGVAELDPPEIVTFDGPVDAEQVEATQPFAARTLTAADGTEIGQSWLVATGGSEVGDAYIAAARERWSIDDAIDQYAPEVGVRLWLLTADDTMNLWSAPLLEDSLVVVRSSTAVDPELITDLLCAWRRDAR